MSKTNLSFFRFLVRLRKLWQIVYTKLATTRPDDCLHIREPKESRELMTPGDLFFRLKDCSRNRVN